jgi:RNA ligase (TIGR02306 family)
MERKLASIQRIINLTPIDGADAIETATILGWSVVVKKGEFKIGDLCVYFEIDSLLPFKP